MLKYRVNYFFIYGLLFYTAVYASKIQVGPTRQYKTPSEVVSVVQEFDTVEIDSGTYVNESSTWRANHLTLRGRTKGVHLIAPSIIPNQKAIWVVAGNNTLIENIEFSGASVPDQNGAGIRIEGGNITIKNCYFHDNENGVLGGSGSNCNIVIENSEFFNNGFGDGYSHNLYIGNAASLIFRYCYTHQAKIGHLLKTRAQQNYILYNRIMDENTGTASYEIDIPNGGTSYIIGNLIQQGDQTDNSTMVIYGEEGISNSGKDLYVINNTIVNDLGNGTFIQVANSALTAKIKNNLFVGSGTLVSGPVDTSSNAVTNTPNFINRSIFDYRPTALTPGINRGEMVGNSGTYSLAPIYQYGYNTKVMDRPQIGIVDIGAYEYDGSVVGVMVGRIQPQKFTSTDVQPSIYRINGQRVCKYKLDKLNSNISRILLKEEEGYDVYP